MHGGPVQRDPAPASVPGGGVGVVDPHHGQIELGHAPRWWPTRRPGPAATTGRRSIPRATDARTGRDRSARSNRIVERRRARTPTRSRWSGPGPDPGPGPSSRPVHSGRRRSRRRRRSVTTSKSPDPGRLHQQRAVGVVQAVEHDQDPSATTPSTSKWSIDATSDRRREQLGAARERAGRSRPTDRPAGAGGVGVPGPVGQGVGGARARRPVDDDVGRPAEPVGGDVAEQRRRGQPFYAGSRATAESVGDGGDVRPGRRQVVDPPGQLADRPR